MKKPTYRITLCLVLLHGCWTFALWFAVYHLDMCSDEVCWTRLFSRSMSAVSCSTSNFLFLLLYRQHNVFDHDELGALLWKIVVAFKYAQANAEQRETLTGARNRHLGELSSLPMGPDDIRRTEAIAQRIMSSVGKSAHWPSFSMFVLRVLFIFVSGILIYLSCILYALDYHSADMEIPNIHFALLLASAFAIVCVWAHPFWYKLIPFQDFRFLIRASTFYMISFIITKHCIERKAAVEWQFSVIAWFIQSAMWLVVLDDNWGPTDFRILACMVTLINVLVPGGLDAASNMHREMLMTELLDICTQRLLTKDNRSLMVALRLAALAMIFAQHLSRVDIAFSALFTTLLAVV